MNIKTEKISLEVSDGSKMEAYSVCPDDADKHRGILVFQEAFGVNHYIRGIAERFANEGYIAIAPELFHRTHPGFEGSYTNMDRAPVVALTNEGIEADARAAYEWLKNHPQVDADKIASVGFCMGGRVSYIANSILPLKAAISFYGGGIAPDFLGRAKDLHAPMLFFWGGLDAHIGPDVRRGVIDAMDLAKKVYANFEFSDADHGFFCDERASYKKEASDQAWVLTKQFLKTYLI